MWGKFGICTLALIVAKTSSRDQLPLKTIASRSSFPLGLSSCSTSLSKMSTYAAPRGRGSGKEHNGKGCVAWIPTWFPKQISEEFKYGLFLRGFCAASEVLGLREKQSNNPEHSPITGEFSSQFNAFSNELYGRANNVRIFRMKKEADGTVYQKVVHVFLKVGH